MKLLSSVLLTLLMVASGFATAASFSVTKISELADDATAIYLVNVTDVADLKWSDESGQRILIAATSIERTIRGRNRIELALAFKPTVSDQPKFVVARRYLVFVYGQHSPLVLAQQTATLSISGEEVDLGWLRGEPKTQPLSKVLSRLGVAGAQ